MITFTKAVATGNDFVVIDDRLRKIKGSLSSLAKILCDRKRSVGGDGLLVIGRSKRQDIKMRIFNPDGSEAEMCGNGSRCVALFAYTKRITKKTMSIETMAGQLSATVAGKNVKVRLTDPLGVLRGVDLGTVGGHSCTVDCINTGVPHAVCYTDGLSAVDVEVRGRLIRYHEQFASAGTNVDFVQVTGPSSIEVRTYERGVEGETLACGTGSVASAILAAARFGMRPPIDVMTASGEKLNVHFTKQGDAVSRVYLEGVASLVFEGTIDIRKRG